MLKIIIFYFGRCLLLYSTLCIVYSGAYKHSTVCHFQYGFRLCKAKSRLIYSNDDGGVYLLLHITVHILWCVYTRTPYTLQYMGKRLCWEVCGSTARFISHYLRPPAGLNSHHSSAGFILPAKIGIYNHHNKVVMSRGPVRIQYIRGPILCTYFWWNPPDVQHTFFLGCPEACSILGDNIKHASKLC